jgi:hypothetical protein
MDVIGDAHPNQAAHDCLSGGGSMGALMRATGWASTPFGRVEEWAQSLRMRGKQPTSPAAHEK